MVAAGRGQCSYMHSHDNGNRVLPGHMRETRVMRKACEYSACCRPVHRPHQKKAVHSKCHAFLQQAQRMYAASTRQPWPCGHTRHDT
eukprot:1145149-Pelagomonas_calceolata.AAC.2